MQPDPIPYSKIQIGDTVYECKFRAGDLFRLKKGIEPGTTEPSFEGIDIFEQKELKGLEAFEHTLRVLQAAIAHQAVVPFTKLVDLVDWTQTVEINVCLTEAISKVTAQQPRLQARIDALKKNQEEAKAMAQQTPSAPLN